SPARKEDPNDPCDPEGTGHAADHRRRPVGADPVHRPEVLARRAGLRRRLLPRHHCRRIAGQRSGVPHSRSVRALGPGADKEGNTLMPHLLTAVAVIIAAAAAGLAYLVAGTVVPWRLARSALAGLAAAAALTLWAGTVRHA